MVDSELAEESLMLFFLLLTGLFSASVSADPQWFDRHSEGWFWYEQIIEPEKEEREINAQNVRAQPLSTAWIRKNIGQYLDKAIDHPSQENVSNYLYLDRLVKEKAEQFARVSKQVIESDPLLDENVRRPISPAAAKIKDDIAYQAKESVLKELGKKAGLVFYYQGRCRLCELQLKSLRQFCHQFEFMLVPISTDGVLLPGITSNRVELHPPDKLNILRYPALFLMHPPDHIVLLRQGNISLTELTEQILQAAVQHQWITREQFNNTRITSETWYQSQPDNLPPTFYKAIKQTSVSD
ncbi:conjugal transfer protein TraF [Endozoicomonas lisbonensis]